MSKFEIIIPSLNELKINTTDLSLYNYDFESFSLVPIQEAATKDVYKKMSKTLTRNVAAGKLTKKALEENDVEYVAKLSDNVRQQLKEGKLDFVVEKLTGETKATLRDTKTGDFAGNINLEKKDIKDLGSLPELAAMQSQLNEISEQLEDINHNIKRVEQGQYNDRYAGFFSTRQMLMESMSLNDDVLKRQLLSSAIQSSNETIGKLMLTLRQDANDFLDFKLKQSKANELENRINESLSYLNSTIQLNLITYTMLGEPQAVLSTVSNYRSFINQTFLTPLGNNTRSVAWQIDNAKPIDRVSFNELTTEISNNIHKLVEDNMNLVLEDSYE